MARSPQATTARLVVATAAMALTFAACGSDGDGSIGDLVPGTDGTPSVSEAIPVTEPPTEPPPEATSAPAPEPTNAPAPAPEGTIVLGVSATEDDGSLVPVVLGIGLLVLAAVIVGAIIARRSETPSAPATASPQLSLLTNAQWIHDHLALELLAAPPTDALQRWASERTRLDEVAIGAQQQWTDGRGEAWGSLSQTMTSLGTALDTNLRLRAQTAPDPALIQESTAVVNRQRALLIQVISALWPSVTPRPGTP